MESLVNIALSQKFWDIETIGAGLAAWFPGSLDASWKPSARKAGSA
jgi:hypothetical protein